jgi:hypothetical protein
MRDMEPASPDLQPIRFSLRRMFVVLTVIAVVVGLLSGGVRWTNSIVIRVEQNAARQRVRERGSDTDYDRHLLGAEVDALKAEYQKRRNDQKLR